MPVNKEDLMKAHDMELINAWVSEVHDNNEEIDPDLSMDWECLAIGFFMGKGADFERAKRLYAKCIEIGAF